MVTKEVGPRRAQILAKNESYRTRNLAMDASKIEL